MALNVVVKETCIETTAAFGIGTFIDHFITDSPTETFPRLVAEVIASLIANGLAANAYISYAKVSGDPKATKLLPFLMVLGYTQPKLGKKLNTLSLSFSSKVQSIVSPPLGTPTMPSSPSVSGNVTSIVNTGRAPSWARK